MKLKEYILLILKNLAHPAGIAGLVIALLIPFLVYLGPNVGQKETIRQLDLYLPLPLFLVQLAAGITLFALLNKDFREFPHSFRHFRRIPSGTRSPHASSCRKS